MSSSSSISCDSRSYLRAITYSASTLETSTLLYPVIFEISKIQPNLNKLPVQTRARYDRLLNTSCYIITNGLNLFLWVGNQTSDEYIQNVFGLSSASHINIENCRPKFELCDTDSNVDIIHLRDSLSLVRQYYTFSRFMRLQVVRQGDQQIENWFKSAFLVEDASPATSHKAYDSFLCDIHSQIREFLSS